MAFAISETIQHKRSWVLKITRWAKAKPGKAQVMISFLQIVLMILGIVSGYNLKKVGYELPGTTAFVFGAIIAAGFLSIHFLPKRSTIAMPSDLDKQRLVFTGIAVSSFVMMILFGNRIEERYPNSFITHAVNTIDRAIFPDDGELNADRIDLSVAPVYNENSGEGLSVEPTSMAVLTSYAIHDKKTINPPGYSKKESRAKLKAEKKAIRLEKKKAKMLTRIEKSRLTLAGGLSAGAVLLIILLVIMTCAGVCLVIGGVAALSSEVGIGILAIVTGGFVSWQAVRMIGRISKREKEKPKKEP